MQYPTSLSRFTPVPYEIKPGDIYVSTHGDDGADGSFDHPYATIERAVQAVRGMAHTRPITVCVHAGTYRTGGIHLTAQDSGSEDGPITYRAYGDGQVMLDGGITLSSADFRPVSEPVRSRLHENVRDKVYEIDLTAYGLTPADWGPVYPIGAFGTEGKYDDFTPGENCELFMDGQRMRLARYPSEGFLQLRAVADVGDCREFPEQNYFWDWDDRRNHRGGAYITDRDTGTRVRTWHSTDGVWAYGYFYHDWADSSTPIVRYDTQHDMFYPAYVCRYGARKDALYYFFNVLDELDAPGEWYLDRDRGMLYFYPPKPLDGAQVSMTITQKSVITAENVNHLCFEGFTLTGTRADALTIIGDHCTVRDVTVHGVMGNGVRVTGHNNVVTRCDISHTGRGGIVLDGGDRVTLTPGSNVADNNLIHDWAEVYMMYNPAIRLDGVGNTCSHNEIFNSPHSAIFYYGNDHVIEYNYIHDVVTHASDAGAIYSGQDWTRQGCVVRYNCLCRVGGDGFTPDGIYFDDMLSGQTAYGNLVIGVGKNGFLIGGGRDNSITGNMVIGCGTGIKYDDRGSDGFKRGGWAKHAVLNYEKGSMWKALRAVPYTSPVWAAKYPALAKVTTDFAQADSPDFPVNPAYSQVKDNIVIDPAGNLGVIREDVTIYGDVSDNAVFTSMQDAGIDEQTYELSPESPARQQAPEFEDIPLSQIGRY